MPTEWTLEDGERLNREHPDTFDLPARKRRRHLEPHDLAKLIFKSSKPCPDGPYEGARSERMWVEVVRVKRTGGTVRYFGELSSEPHFIKSLAVVDAVEFAPEHVIQIDRVSCCDCRKPTPSFTDDADLVAKGWAARPHPEEPKVTTFLCPGCSCIDAPTSTEGNL